MLEQVVDYHGRELTVETVQSGLGLTGDARSNELAHLVLTGDLGDGLALIASVRDDGLDLRQFQREVVSYLRQLLLVAAGADSALSLTKEQAKEMKKALEGVGKEEIVRALRAFGQVDVRADPLSSLPLEIALAECVLARNAVVLRRQRSKDVKPRLSDLQPSLPHLSSTNLLRCVALHDVEPLPSSRPLPLRPCRRVPSRRPPCRFRRR